MRCIMKFSFLMNSRVLLFRKYHAKRCCCTKREPKSIINTSEYSDDRRDLGTILSTCRGEKYECRLVTYDK